MRINPLTLVLLVAAVAASDENAVAQHFDIFLARPAAGNQTVIGGADVDALSYDDTTRVFAAELDEALGEYFALEPGVNHPNSNEPALSAFPASASPLLPGDTLRLFERQFTIGGTTDELFFWNGVGAVTFAPAAADFRLDGADPLDSQAGAGGSFDDHPFLVVDDDSLPGVYLASVYGIVDGYAASDSVFLVLAAKALITADFLGVTQQEFDLLSDEQLDEALEHVLHEAVEYVESSVVPEPASLVLLAVGLVWGGSSRWRRVVQRRRSFNWLGLGLLALCLASSTALAVEDVMLQTINGKIVTGIVDDGSEVGELGARVFPGNFLSNYRAANPGFFSLTSLNPNLPAGAFGFPAQHDVGFELVPMRLDGILSNLLYWDGRDAGGNGLDLADVHFAPPVDVEWRVVDGNSANKIAAGTSETIAGGFIQRTFADTNPGDGIDTGLLHQHLALLLNQTTGGTPPAGVYAIAWQVNSPGFEASEPFVFVHRTSTVSNAVRDLAADWLEANLESLFAAGLPGDYNADLAVDAADYTVWRDRLDQSSALPNETASLGVVDWQDYGVWQAQFGQSTTGGAGGVATNTVPEPTMLAGAIASVVAVIAHGRRQARRGLGSIRRQC